MMDALDVEPGALEESLRFIRGVNRWLGGVRAVTGALDRYRVRWGGEVGTEERPLRVLDVGTGSADVPVAIARWGAKRGVAVRVTALDLHPTTLAAARRYVIGELGAGAIEDGAVELVEGDALELTDRFADRSFDYVHAGMFIHHLSDMRVLTALTQMDRVALRGIVWNDLLRSGWSRFGIRVLTAGAGAMVKHDARVSVDAGFTRREVLGIRDRLSLGYTELRVSRMMGRFVLAGDRSVLGAE